MSLKLTAQPRTVTGKKVQTLRNTELLPIVVYGRGKQARSLQVSAKEFRHIFDEAGSTSLVDLTIDGESPIKVLIHDLQLDPVSDMPLHADLLELDMAKKITAEVPLVTVGESPAVETLEGSLLMNQDTVEVECLPKDLPKEITVDISSLATFDDTITAGNLKLPDGVTLLTDAELDLILVQPPREEEVEEVSAEEAEKAVVEGMEAEAAEKAAEGEADEDKKDGDKE